MRSLHFLALLAVIILAACASTTQPAAAQGTIQQSGPVIPFHSPVWLGNGVQGDAGSAAGTSPSGTSAAGLSEQLLSARGTGTPPYANAGTGPLGTNWCDYDAPVTNANGYHYLCLSPNAQGGGLIAYGAGGIASPTSLYFSINGVLYAFPAGGGNVAGPTTTIIGDLACWNNTAGTLLYDCGPGPNNFREVSTGTTDTALVTDATIAWNSSTGSPKTETLYACTTPRKGNQIYIKDEYGNAGTYAITLTPAGSDTIDKNLATVNISVPLGGLQIQCSGSGNWIVK